MRPSQSGWQIPKKYPCSLRELWDVAAILRSAAFRVSAAFNWHLLLIKDSLLEWQKRMLLNEFCSLNSKNRNWPEESHQLTKIIPRPATACTAARIYINFFAKTLALALWWWWRREALKPNYFRTATWNSFHYDYAIESWVNGLTPMKSSRWEIFNKTLRPRTLTNILIRQIARCEKL